VTSANLDLVQMVHARWERGDFDSADWADPEIEYVVVDGPDPGSWSGPAEMAKAFGGILSAWEQWSVEADEYRELDADRVLVLEHFSARGRTSGLEAGHIGSEVASLFHIRGGKVAKLVQYWDPQRALAELGL
jgi:ketosteroid isomerase-like protein